jgi:hypothetical protein
LLEKEPVGEFEIDFVEIVEIESESESFLIPRFVLILLLLILLLILEDAHLMNISFFFSSKRSSFHESRRSLKLEIEAFGKLIL